MKPIVQIDFGNDLYNDLFIPRLQSFKFTDRDEAADKVEMTFRNEDLALLDWYPPGIAISSRFGWSDGILTPLRTMKIKRLKFKGTSDLALEGFSQEFEMDKVQKTRTFEDTNYAGVADFIAFDYGYQPDNVIVTDDDVFHDAVPQMGETDAHFLRRLAKELDFVFWADEREFHFHERDYSEKPRHLLEFRRGELLGNISGLDGDLNLIRSPQTVKKKGWDPKKKKEVESTADGTDSGNTLGAFEPGLFPSEKTFVGVRFDDVFGVVRKYQVGSDIVEERDGQLVTVGVASETQSKEESSTAQSDEEAGQDAKKTLKKKKNQRIKFKLKLDPGDPRFLAKMVVELRGASILDGPIYIKEAVHEISAGNYTTELSLIKGYLGKKPKKGAGSQNTEETDGSPNSGTSGSGFDTKIKFWDDGTAEVIKYDPSQAPKKLKGGYY